MTAGITGTPPLNDRIAVLSDELNLSIKWDRPCILLAVYQSEYVRKHVQSTLRQSLHNQENTTLNYQVDKVHFDVALDLRDYPGREHTIFFISGLRWGGGKGRSNAYHALNMHREYLVEEKIRSIFWLTKFEARILPRHAPDFWAFRYHVIEFFDYPSSLSMHSIDPQRANYQESIDGILGKLNTNPHDMDLHSRLARLYQEIGCYEDALVQYYKILRISPNNKNTWLEIAELFAKMKRPDRTNQILKKVASQERNDKMIMDGVERFKSLTGSN